MSDVQVYSIYIQAPAEKVWEAITSEVAGGGDPGQGGGGWPWVLASLKTVLETGKPMVGAGS